MSFMSRGPKPKARKVTIAQIWDIGKERAYNPGRMTRIKHSGFVHRNRKPGSVIKNVVSAAGEAIPVPVVASLVNMAVEKGIAKWKQEVRGAKIDSYSFGTTGFGLEKKVKHTIKNLDVEELDRSRAKVKSAIEDVNKVLANSDWIDNQNYCDYRADVAQAYHYLEKRIDLLDARAAVFEAVAQDAHKWAAEQRSALVKSQRKCEEKLNRNQEALFHAACSSFCVKPQERT